MTSPVASPSSAPLVAEPSPVRLPAAPSRPNVLDPGSSEEGDCMDAEGRVKTLTIYNSHVIPGGRKSKGSKTETKTSSTSRQESETQSTSSPGSSSRPSKKSHGTSSARKHSPTPKTFESTSATSPITTDLVSTASSVSGSGGKTSVRKSSTSSLSSQQFVPNPLYAILKDEGVLEEYKQHLSGHALEQLCTMTDNDLEKAGLPLEPCLAVINGVKNHVLAKGKPLNGTITPKINAADMAGDAMLPFISRATPPILDFRSTSAGPDSVPVVAPVPIGAVPYANVGTLSVDTGSHMGSGERMTYVDVVNGTMPSAPCSSNMTPQISESNAATDVSFATAFSDPRFQSSTQPKFMVPSNSDVTAPPVPCSLMSNDPSIVSAAWIQSPLEEDLPSVMRSYSVDSGDPTAAATYMVNFNATSSSLPPSQSQSPAPNEGQPQQPVFFPPAVTGPMSTSATFPVPHNSNNNQYLHHHQQRNPKHSYRSSGAAPHAFKGGHHGQNAMQRRNYAATTYDYPRPQQPPLVSLISPHQSMAGHQMALSAIPAANFVRAPPTAASATVPPQPRIRLVCQQCNGASTNCSMCQGNWNNGLLTPANAAAAGTPMLFHLTTTPTGPPPTAQMFPAAYLTSPPGNNPMAAQFFNAPPPNYRLSSPMVFKSASATLVSGEHPQHHMVMDQQLMRNMANEAAMAMPYLLTHPMGSCCNCGLQGHTRETCMEPTLDDMTASGHFHLNLASKEDSATSQDR